MDALAYRNRYGLLSEDIDPETGTLWGNFPQTYSMAGLILTANAALAKLGGSILARLIVVSNRVAVPSRDGGNLAGGLAVAVRSLLKRHEGLWFGWSGTVSRDEDIATKTVQHGGMSYAVTDLAEADYQEYYNGFAMTSSGCTIIISFPLQKCCASVVTATVSDSSCTFRFLRPTSSPPCRTTNGSFRN